MKHFLALLLLAAPLASQAAYDEPLPSRLAFQVQGRQTAADTIVLDFQIPAGYFLYKQKLGVASGQGFLVKQVRVEGVKQITDPMLGTQDVLDGASRVVLVGSVTGPDVTVQLKMQGCLKDQLCYPPEVRQVPISR